MRVNRQPRQRRARKAQTSDGPKRRRIHTNRRQAEVQGFSSAARWTPPTGTLGMLTSAAHDRAASVAGTLDELRLRARDAATPPPLAAALRGEHIGVITEI